MDRALALDHVALALGEHGSLPSARELIGLIAEAEVSLFKGQVQVDPRLFDTAWYLHSVASALPALELYGLEQQRAAFQVSGHLFDLLLQQRAITGTQRLRAIFAAQIAYLRGDLNPNAIAAYRLKEAPYPLVAFGHRDSALQIGSAIAAFDTAWLFPALYFARETRNAGEASWNIQVGRTIYGSAGLLVEGAWDLLRYLVYGQGDALEAARHGLDRAVVNEPSREDLDSRWVAFHLRQLTDLLGQSSLWSVLPPDTAPSIARAFTMAQPPILSLWPPQVQLLSNHADYPGVFDPEVKRMVWSVPTSAGKTLLSQVVIADHLVRQASGVCFVAPTRSLCREVERNLRRRLRLLSAVTEITFLDTVFEVPIPDDTTVEVMTPERLAYLLRSDPDAVLQRFGLFVIDEAHSITDGGRGWTLEWSLATLHELTRETTHRIVAMSAALGQRANLVSWLDPEGRGVDFHSEWRGPRRVHAIYTSEPDWDHPTEVPRPLANSPHRIQYDTFGHLRIRPTGAGQIHQLATTQPTGQLVLRQPQNERVENMSTAFYKTLAPIAEILGRSGPVLVIASTKLEAMHLARQIAGGRQGDTPASWLTDLAEGRLGAEHPLVQTLRARVAYHHGSLPSDVLLAIEEALAGGELDIVVSTTTLTEGVNLPVRTVIIASQGAFTGAAGYAEYITGARLLNAIGRAGRAARESEGWVVLARNARFTPTDFDRLRPTEGDMPVRSVLASDIALEQLARLEAEIAQGVDIALARPGELLENFLAYVWFAASLSGADQADVDEVHRFVQATLAWQQLGETNRNRLSRVVDAARVRYDREDATARRRWSRAGTTLPSATVLDGVARELSQGAPEDPGLEGLLRLLDEQGALARILALPEAKLPRIRTRRGGAARHIEVDNIALMRQWIDGVAMSDLANTHLAAVDDAEFRFEQLADYVTSAFENFLPWALGLALEWANALRAADDVELLSANLPAFIRYGVNSEEAVLLIRSGVPSRTIATAVARDYLAERVGPEQTIRSWLASLTLADWRERYHPTPADFRTLLDYARSPETRLAARILQGDTTEVPLRTRRMFDGRRRGEIVDEPGLLISQLVLRVDGLIVGSIAPEHHAEIAALRDTGIPMNVEAEFVGAQLMMFVTLVQT